MTTLTKEDIFELFRDTDRKMRDTDRKMQETDRKMQETDRKMQETDRKMQETALELKETARLVKEMTRAIGRLGNRLGEFVEEMVRPAVVQLFQQRGIDVHYVFKRASAKFDDDAMEIDLLVVNSSDAILVETKSELSVEDVKEHLDRLARFKKLFPMYQNHCVMGAMAAMVVPDDAARFAYRQGLFVLAQSGETMIIRNDEKFKPAVW